MLSVQLMPAMWSWTVLLLALLPQAFGGQIFDVTTIYDVEHQCGPEPKSNSVNGRVYIRTNALGLPLYDANENLLSEITHHDALNLTCDLSVNTCSWNVKDWLKDDGTIGTYIKTRTTYRHRKILMLKFERFTHGIYNYLVFTEDPSNIRSQTQYFIIQFWYYYNNIIYLFRNCNTYRTSSYQFTMTDRDETSVSIYCDFKTEIPFYYSNMGLTFSFSDNKVEIFKTSGYNLVHTWSEPLQNVYEKYKYFSVHGSDFDRYSSSSRIPVVTAPKEGSEMISPPVTPDSGQLCLVLVLYSLNDTAGDVLQVLAQDLHQVQHPLQAVSNLKIGKNIKYLNLALGSIEATPVKLIIKKVGSVSVSISMISSCNMDGEEVRDVPFSSLDVCKLRDSNISFLPVLTVDTNDIVKSERVNTTNHCLNGGMLTTDGCSCPPGFYGSECKTGCGRNRFGQDCGGLCSVSPQQCKGLLLCTAETSCHCAPGYEGQECTTECSPGKFGNDCEQLCGHCASGGPCDIYTGECSACEQGYFPPHCKQVSTFYLSRPELLTPEYERIIVKFNPLSYNSDSGPPILYQVQYREKRSEWHIYTTKTIPISDDISEEIEVVTEELEGLKTGALYEVRLLMMDADFNKYDGELVQTAEILTKCDVPAEFDYRVTSESNTTSITFYWRYENQTEFWCPVVSYDVSWKYGGRWINQVIPSDEESFILTNLLPSLKIKFKVRARTSGGLAPYSSVTQYSTQHNGTSKVKDLRVVSRQSSSAKISWEPPSYSDGRHLKYTVAYKCVDQPACSPGCHNVPEGVLTTDETSFTISPLLPLTQYLLTITPENGEQASTFVGTTDTLPTETPSLSAREPERTNTSITVFWDQQPVCSNYLQGYNYQLFKELDSLMVLATGFTKDTSVTFHNLTASTEYVVRVFVTTLAGWNPQAFLAINTSTSATVPEAVRNLTLYKRGRNTLGLRWAAPRATYGQLKSFTVSHSLGQEEVTHTVQLTPCTVWPELYCHTIEGLRANRKYNITVSARNSEVPEDGVGTSIEALTKETYPTAPENLKLINTSSTSVNLQWGYPNLANGVIRSFVINVEETEKFDQDSCCQDYPLVETPVIKESPTYEGEVSGLLPASTYFVSVTAKTVGMGTSQSLVVYTRPPHLDFSDLPQLQYSSNPDIAWLPLEIPSQLNNSDLYTALIKTHLLLAVTNESVYNSVDSGILDAQLDSLLQEMITDPFFFVMEYNQGEEVFLSGVEEESESEWGSHPSPSPLKSGQKYQLIAVQVSEYNGVYNADLRYTNTFTLLS